MRGRRRLACREAVELVTDYLEEALPPTLRGRFEGHLRACRSCAEHLRQVLVTVRALRRLPAPAVDTGTRADLVGLHRRWTTTR